MKKIKIITCLICLFSSQLLVAQEIKKLTFPAIDGTVCPIEGTQYEVTSPGDLGGCKVQWSVTNGDYTVDSNDSRKITVNWKDIPGAIGKITATFVYCTNSLYDNTEAPPLEELILSVKDQSWDLYTNSVNIDYCTEDIVYLNVPQMFVKGTGGLDEPPKTEVAYVWTLPSGWEDISTGATGVVIRYESYINITPTKCAVPGKVRVEGTIRDYCGSSALSSAAEISLNGADPIVTIGPESGYSGPAACKTDPVTFTATMNYALACVSNYTWQFPLGWKWLNPSTNIYESSPVSTTSNTIDLTPSGSSADAGAIKVSAKFSCGNMITSGNYNAVFNEPYISGPDIICPIGGEFELMNVVAGPGVTINWSVDPTNLTSPYSGSGLVANIAAVSTSSKGTAKIAYSVSGDCPAFSKEKSFIVGTPLIEANTIKIYNGIGEQGYWCTDVIGNDFSFSYPYLYDYFEVRLYNFDGTELLTEFTIIGTEGTMNAYPSAGFYSLWIRAVNQCGAATDWAKQVVEFKSCSLDGGFSTLSVSPNPASQETNISIVDKENIKSDQFELWDIQIYDKDQRLIFERKNIERKVITVNTRQFKDDIYFIRAYYKGEIIESKLMVSK